MPAISTKGDRQRQSEMRTTLDQPPIEQLQQRLLAMSRADMQSIDHNLIRRQPSLLCAVKLCISMGGLSADKEVYVPLGIDAGHWTRITRGEAHFPIDKLVDLMDLCGNEAPLLWLLDARGYQIDGLRRKESELERDLRMAREEVARMRAEQVIERRLLADIYAGRVQQ